mmetsp:Transcript_24229/g.52944  ORF Transcript_24229/g.52944 Transcript_24229/m.52944 type:complete len:159 (+) Transcript_24229:142-618(+)
MELHHKLRRDPSWHPNACNICGQLGHQAAQCTSGTVNWRQIYGDSTFILRGPVYWSEELARLKARQVNHGDLEKRAREFAKTQAESQGLDWEEIQKKAQELQTLEPSALIKPVAQPAEEELPAGWAATQDPSTGRTYFWHKKTQKVTWERPTADTPIN